MPELTHLIGPDNWRKIRPMLPISKAPIPVTSQADKSVEAEKPADHSADVAGFAYSPAFDFDAEGRN